MNSLFGTRSRDEEQRLIRHSSGDDGYLDLRRMWAAMRRQLPVAALGAALGLALAVLYLLASHPQYRAVDTVLLDQDRADLLDQVSAMPSAARSDTAVQSEVEIIKSQTLALSVVDELGLAENEDFLNPPASPGQRIKSAIKSVAAPVLNAISAPPPAPLPEGAAAGAADTEKSEADQRRYRAAAILQGNLDVSRVSRSYVMQIMYTGYRPDRVTRIARAYGELYRKFQLRSNSSVAGDAMSWLEDRLDQMQERSQQAAKAVQEFRVAHDLVSVRGEPLSGQQLSDMTSELIRANADAAQARARRDALRALLAEGPDQAAAGITIVAETPAGERLGELNAKLLDLQSRRSEVVARNGEDDQQASRLAARIDALRQQIYEELQRAEKGLNAAWEVARSREQSLRSSLDAVSSEALASSSLRTRLQQLEKAAETYGEVYRDSLRRYEQAAQQQSFPIASVRIISQAEEPKSPVSPNRSAILAVGLVLGGMMGAAVGLGREVREQPLRTREDVREALGIACFGLLPRRWQVSTAAEAMRRRTLHALQDAISAESRDPGPYVVGVSALPGHTRSELADEFACFLARQSLRVLLLVLDQPHVAAPGNVTSSDPYISVLRYGYFDPRLPGEMSEFLEKGLDRYEYVIMNLPVLGESTLPEIFEPMIDAAVLELGWNRTERRLARAGLEDNPAFAGRLVGAILANANVRRARRYLERGGYEAQLLRSGTRQLRGRRRPGRKNDGLKAKVSGR